MLTLDAALRDVAAMRAHLVALKVVLAYVKYVSEVNPLTRTDLTDEDLLRDFALFVGKEAWKK